MKSNNIIEKDMYSFLSSAGLLAANGYFNILPDPLINISFMALTSITGGIVLNDIISSKWEKLFKSCGIVNKEGEYPKELKKEKTDKGVLYTLSIPTGLSLSSFVNQQSELETAMNEEIIFTKKSKSIEMLICNDDVLNWQRVFKNCKIYNNEGVIPELLTEEENELGKKYTFNIPMGLDLESIEKKKSSIEVAIKQPLQFSTTEDFKLIMQVYDLKYKEIYNPKDYNIVLNPNKLRFYTGIRLTTDGEVVDWFDINRSNSHLLLCGMSGKGKTALMRYLIAQAMLKYNTEVYISELKPTGAYNKFKPCKNLIKMVKSPKETYEMITEIEKEMQRRYKLIDDADVSDQMEYNKKFPKNKLPNIILLIEEFVILSRNQEAIETLYVLLSQGSGAGIFIWLTVQRPDAKTLDSRLKSLLSYTISFQAKTCINSEIYLDKGDYRARELLKGKGECIILKEDCDTLFKAFFIDTPEIIEMVKHTYIDKKEPVIEIKENKEVKLID